MSASDNLSNISMSTEVLNIVNSAGFGFCEISPEGRLLCCNDNFYSIFELDKNITRNELDIKTQNMGIALFLNQLVKNKFHSEELSIQTPDCIDKHLLLSGIFDAVKFLILIQDMTSRKKIELGLRNSQMLLCSIINTIPDIVYRIDKEGQITFVNDEIKNYGYDPSDLIGKNICEIVHPDDRRTALYHIKERRTGERRTRLFEMRLLSRKKPEHHSISGRSFQNMSPLFAVSAEGIYLEENDSGKTYAGTQGVARDITRKKYTEYALLKNEEKWRTILEGLEDGYYELNLEGKFIYINKAFCEIAELDYDMMIGTRYDSFFKSPDSDKLSNSFDEVYRTGIPAKLADWTITTGSGIRKYIEGSISLIRDIDAEVTGFRGIVRDISKRKKIEEELLRVRKLEAIGILAGGIAHDYNNALTAILGNISLAKMEISDSNGECMEILNDAEEASIKAIELTKRLSTFAQGGRPLMKTTNVGPVIQETVAILFVDYKGEISMSIPADLWSVEIDEFQIRQVFSYLIQNALEAVSADGEISISADNVIVDKEESYHELTLQPDSYVMICVHNDGKGILEEHKNSIFDPYFTTKEFASGMGLATSYAIIKRHHGYISVKSNDFDGTSFYVYLPVAKY